MPISLPGMTREEKITRVPLPQADVRVRALGDAREGRARLALAAGAEVEDLVVGKWPASASVMNGWTSAMMPTDLAAAAMRCIERPTRHTRRSLASAARIAESIRATLAAKQATATLPVQLADQGVQGDAHLGLRPRHPRRQ